MLTPPDHRSCSCHFSDLHLQFLFSGQGLKSLVSSTHSHRAGLKSSRAHQPRIPSCYREHTATAYQQRSWPTLLTWAWSPVIWHFNSNKKILNFPPFAQSWSFLAISHRDPRTQIPQPYETFSSPAGTSQTSHTRVNLLQSISSCSPLHAASTC